MPVDNGLLYDKSRVGPACVVGYRRGKEQRFSAHSVRRLLQGFFWQGRAALTFIPNCNLTVDHSHAKRRHSWCESFITRRWAPFPRSPAVKDVPFFWRGTTFHRTDKHYCVIFEIFLRADAFVIVMKLGTWWLGVFLLKSFHFDCDYCSYSQQERTCQHAMSFCSRPISILSCITQ